MTPQILSIGQSQSQIIIIDDFSRRLAEIRDVAAEMAPFPPARNHYPGLRRYITPHDTFAQTYVDQMMRAVTEITATTYEFDNIDCLEASFSLVTQTPDTLTANQRAPHFDNISAKYLALLHYLSPARGMENTADTGTAFYRHRATGIERVTSENIQAFITLMKLESPEWPQTGYISGSNDFFEQIGEVRAAPDRLAIYQGALLHTGHIGSGTSLSSDPRIGRLTTNVFAQGK